MLPTKVICSKFHVVFAQKNGLQHFLRQFHCMKWIYCRKCQSKQRFSAKLFCCKYQDIHQLVSTNDYDVHSTEEWLAKYPKLTDPKLRPSVYILDHALAGVIVEKLGGRDLSDERAAWLEVNPGPGMVTRALLDAGLPQLIAIEQQNMFNPELEEIKERYPGRFEYFNKDFFRYPFSGDKYYELLKLMPGLSPKSFTDDPPLKVICHTAGNWLNERKFTLSLQYKLLQCKDSIFSQGRVQFITLVSSYEHMNLTATFPSKSFYRPKNVLQHLMFDTESLLKVPIEYLHPAPLMKTYKEERKKKLKNEPFVLLRLTPKRNLFEQVLPAEYLGLFKFYLKEMLIKKKARLIPKVDFWFPSRGLDLIKAGYSMTDTIQGVNPDHLLDIFKMILTWPELHSSSFYSEYRGQHSHMEEELPT